MQRLTDKNRLSIVRPRLCQEWDSEKNGLLTPADVSFGSHQSVWWICNDTHNPLQGIVSVIQKEIKNKDLAFVKSRLESFDTTISTHRSVEENTVDQMIVPLLVARTCDTTEQNYPIHDDSD